jgi:hypothetical protein
MSMSEVSSARPARLIRFGVATDNVHEGLSRRIEKLREALAHYERTCDPDYRMPTADTVDVVGAWRDQARQPGDWVRAVGKAVEAAQCGTGTDGRFDPENVGRLRTDALLTTLRSTTRARTGTRPFPWRVAATTPTPS